MATITVPIEKHDISFCGDLAAAGFPVSGHDYKSERGFVILTIPKAKTAAVDAVIAAHPKPLPEPADFAGLRSTLIEQWGAEKANDMMAKYPLYYQALEAGNWPVARQMLSLAATRGDLTAKEKTNTEAAMAAHKIPE